MKSRSCALAAAICALPAMAAAATIPTTIRVETADSTVLPLGRVAIDTTPPATVTVNDTLDKDTVSVSSRSAFLQLAKASTAAGTAFGFQPFDFGPMVQQLGGGVATTSAFWRFKVNGAAAAVGAADYTLKSGDSVSWSLVTDWEAPELALVVSGDVARVGTPVVATVKWIDNAARSKPASGVRVTYGGSEKVTDAAGQATFVSVAGTRHLQASAAPTTGAVRSQSLTTCAWTTATIECAPAPLTGADADFVAPSTTITTPRRRAVLSVGATLRGLVTRDRSRIAQVQLAIAKRVGEQCRFLGTNGRLGAARACATRGWLPASRPTATVWSLALPATLPAGTYQVWSRADDGVGNRESTRRPRQNVIGFVIASRP